jgi:hypothetical protein
MKERFGLERHEDQVGDDEIDRTRQSAFRLGRQILIQGKAVSYAERRCIEIGYAVAMHCAVFYRLCAWNPVHGLGEARRYLGRSFNVAMGRPMFVAAATNRLAPDSVAQSFRQVAGKTPAPPRSPERVRFGSPRARPSARGGRSDHGFTVKTVLLVAPPPGVVRTTLPVAAPAGIRKVTC